MIALATALSQSIFTRQQPATLRGNQTTLLSVLGVTTGGNIINGDSVFSCNPRPVRLAAARMLVVRMFRHQAGSCSKVQSGKLSNQLQTPWGRDRAWQRWCEERCWHQWGCDCDGHHAARHRPRPQAAQAGAPQDLAAVVPPGLHRGEADAAAAAAAEHGGQRQPRPRHGPALRPRPALRLLRQTQHLQAQAALQLGLGGGTQLRGARRRAVVE